MNATVVSVDKSPFDEYSVYQNLQADLFLEGDIVASLRLLADEVRASGTLSGKGAEKIVQRRAGWEAAHEKAHEGYRAQAAEARTKSPIDPGWLCAGLTETMPENAIFVDETTTHRPFIQRHLTYNAAQSYFRAPTGLGQGLGYQPVEKGAIDRVSLDGET